MSQGYFSCSVFLDINLPARCWLLFTLIHSKVFLLSSISATLAELPTATWISGLLWQQIWICSVSDPKNGRALLLDAQCSRPGAPCPCSLRRQGTRDEWGQAGVEKSSRGSHSVGGGGGLSEEVHRGRLSKKVKYGGRGELNPEATSNSSFPSSVRLPRSG